MEYEYSFNVTKIDEYINFCCQYKFKFISKTKQTRIIYRKDDQTMARITIDEGDKYTKTLDFKEDKLASQDLNIRRESAVLPFDNDAEVISILNFLGYKKDNTLIRERIIYEKEHVRFEIDQYLAPNNNCVVALEGNKKEVDKI